MLDCKIHLVPPTKLCSSGLIGVGDFLKLIETLYLGGLRFKEKGVITYAWQGFYNNSGELQCCSMQWDV